MVLILTDYMFDNNTKQLHHPFVYTIGLSNI